jgi:hypothetical protein
MNDTKKLQKLYSEIFRDALFYGDSFNMQMIAATYMAIAMRLYKTHLTDEEYSRMIETVIETEVKPYKMKKSKDTIH